LQSPNCVGPLQTTAPSVGHDVLPPPEDGAPLDGAAAGVDATGGAGAAGVEGAAPPLLAGAVTVIRVVNVDVGSGAAAEDPAPGAKTPPPFDDCAGGAGAADVAGAPPSAGAEEAAPPPLLLPPPDAAPQDAPEGSFNFACAPVCTTEPGLGNLVSKF
jgi:hypothetical protein